MRQDSQGLYQEALNKLYDGILSSHDSKQTLANFKLITSMQVSPTGLVSINEAAKVFARIHYNDRQLLNAVNNLEKSIGVTADELLTQKELMLAIPCVLKSFLVKVGSIPDDEEPTVVNYIAFACGVWLEKPETLFSNS